MFDKIMEQINSMDIFCDGILAIDLQGYICCCRSNPASTRPLMYPSNEILGKHLFQAYPSLNAANSTLYKALRGIPTYNLLQRHQNFRGEVFSTYETTLPLKSEGKAIGAVSFTKYEDHLIREIQVEEKALPEDAPAEAIHQLIGDSVSMQMVRSRICQIARSDSGVLLYGDTGTGKGMAAQAIHQLSSRASKPFYEQNCAAIPANLLESMFFGTVKGSYTGAVASEGIFRQCNGGTLFLDEINSMDLNLQAKLLKVLESGEVTPVGGKKSSPVDVRVIAAANEHPIACIQSGNIRSDLFYRLSAVQLELPPLTQRLGDIPVLCDFFMGKYRRQMHRQIFYIDSDVLNVFRQYSWPGNVRELKNLIEGAFVYADGDTIHLSDIPSYLLDSRWNQMTGGGFISAGTPLEIQEDFSAVSADLPLKEAMAQLEKKLIQQRIKRFRTKKALAENLGISRQALDVKLQKYDLHLRDGFQRF